MIGLFGSDGTVIGLYRDRNHYKEVQDAERKRMGDEEYEEVMADLSISGVKSLEVLLETMEEMAKGYHQATQVALERNARISRSSNTE